MLSLVVAVVAGALVYALVAVLLDPVAAVVPAVLVLGLTGAGLLFRNKRLVDKEMEGLVPLLQRRQVENARQFLEGVRRKWRFWVPFLSEQVDANLGMIEYLQMRFDEALPLLEKGSWRNWIAITCVGCIHYRRQRFDKAWECLDKAVAWGPKEVVVYQVYAVLLLRNELRERALKVLAKGLTAIPDSKRLQDLRTTIANKKKIKTQKLGDQWFQFFPEDLVTRQVALAQAGDAAPAFRSLRVSKQMRRGR